MLKPKFASASAPHSAFARGFVRSQSGVRSPSRSFHDRVVWLTRLLIGLVSAERPVSAPKLERYLLRLTLRTVFPLPNRSYAAPSRGDRSCHDVLLSFGNRKFLVGANGV